MDNDIIVTINEMIADLENAKEEARKFIGGNNAAGTRVRKAMQQIKVDAQVVRVTVSEWKNGRDE